MTKNYGMPFFALMLAFMATFHSSVRADEWIASSSGAFEYQPKKKNIVNFFDSLAIAKKVFVYFRSNVDPATGKGWHNIELTNGYGSKGFTVCIETKFSGDDGASQFVRYRLGVNPRGNRNESRDISMSPEAWSKIRTYEIRAGWCPKGDIGAEFVEGVKSVVKTLGYVFDDSEKKYVPKAKPATPPSNQIKVSYVWAQVSCSRPGSTGSVIIEATSKESCIVAQAKLQSEADSGKACLLYAQDATFTGGISFSECGDALVPAE